ncbi:protein of unknown function [Pseudomonas sp. JV551A1]|nr:protein of unknown function [Pseudomonas sp. JV551A1]
MMNKEFFVPMSLEVGRIIRGFGGASTFNFIYSKYSRRRHYQGRQVTATTHSAPERSSAARAALRSTRLLLHLFRANHSCAIGARTLGVWLEIAEEQQAQPSIFEWDRQGGRARQAQERLARNRCRSSLVLRSAARAALDLTGAREPKTGTSQSQCHPKTAP